MIIQDKQQYAGAVSYDGIRGGKYYLIDTIPKLEAMVAELEKQPIFATDTEGSGLSIVFDRPCGISIGWGVSHNFYIPFDHKTNEKQLTGEVVEKYLHPIYANRSISKVLWNAKFDLHMLKKVGISVDGVIHDGLLLSFLYDENGDHGLKDLSDKYIDPECSKWEKVIDAWRTEEAKRRKQELSQLIKEKIASYTLEHLPPGFEGDARAIKKIYKELAEKELSGLLCAKNKKSEVSYDYIPLTLMTPYAASDTHYTWLLFKRYLPLVAQDSDLANLYLRESRLLKVVFDLEHRGAKIDRKYLLETVPEFEEKIASLAKQIFEEVGYEFNINSDDDLRKVFTERGVKLTKLTEGSKAKMEEGETDDLKYSVDKSVLQSLATKYEFAGKINEYNKLVTLKTRYIDGLLELADDKDVIHSSFNLNVSSGRLSSSTPNLTNIPAGDKAIRRAFTIPSDEFIFVFLDESQIELRLVAHLSQDPKLLSCYPFEGKGVDVHTLALAECILQVPYESALEFQVTDPDMFEALRKVAKILNFSIVYGSGAKGLQEQICTPGRYYSLDQCQGYLDNYFKKYRGVKKWIESRKKFILDNGFTQNAFGRYRRFPGINKVFPRWKQAGLLRTGVNFEVQGFAADIFKEATVRIYDILTAEDYRSRLVNMVHDEVQLYIHRDEFHLVKKIKHAMEDFDLTVPLKAEVSYSEYSWAEKKPLKI